MSYYLVSFDLDSSEDRTSTYTIIEKSLGSIGISCKPLNNVYLVATDNFSSVQIRETILPLLKPADNLLVVKLTGEYASYNRVYKNNEIKELFSK